MTTEITKNAMKSSATFESRMRSDPGAIDFVGAFSRVQKLGDPQDCPRHAGETRRQWHARKRTCRGSWNIFFPTKKGEGDEPRFRFIMPATHALTVQNHYNALAQEYYNNPETDPTKLTRYRCLPLKYILRSACTGWSTRIMNVSYIFVFLN